MRHRVLVFVSAMAVLVALVSFGAAPAVAQSASAVRTAWDEPDLRGIWDFRTITPLERPDDLADQAFLTEEEAANLEQANQAQPPPKCRGRSGDPLLS